MLAFELEGGFDYFYVYDEDNLGGQMLLEHTGSTIPPDQQSSGSTLSLAFVSDSSGVLSGYSGKWTST